MRIDEPGRDGLPGQVDALEPGPVANFLHVMFITNRGDAPFANCHCGRARRCGIEGDEISVQNDEISAEHPITSFGRTKS